MEIGLVTPPTGLNANIVKGIPMATIFHGVLPFVASDLIPQVPQLIA